MWSPTSTLRLLWPRTFDPSSPSAWILSPPKYSWWHDMMLLTIRRYVLTDKIDDTMYWYHYDGIMLTWMLGTLSFKLQEIVYEPLDTVRQAWLAIEPQFLSNRETHPSF
jgi:hypothetical protein